MRRTSHFAVYASMMLFLFLNLSAFESRSQDNTRKSSFPFMNPDLPLSDRVNDLIARMTLSEKITQMQHQAPAIERLGIPAYNWWNECLHGVARNGIATVFPQAIGMAATWNPELIRKEADVISTEARAKYAEAISKGQYGIYQGLTFWSPNINIFRDPRWGRGQETYGEDPYLTSRIGKAFVQGLQGNDPTYLKVVATAKHFAVHSGPESQRHKFDAWPSETDLYETYLPAFEALVKEAHVYSVMSCYNRVYGTPSSANTFLFKETLRGKWGFKGYVVSDCWAISDIYNFHKFVPTPDKAAVLSVKAGTDLSCGPEYANLLKAVELGYISEAEIDVSIKRLFEARFRLGMFDPSSHVPYASITPDQNNTEEHRVLARKVAQESIVLLKNENQLLPLSSKIKSIAVIGPYANDTSVLLGNYNGTPEKPVTLLRGISNRATVKMRINYACGVEIPQKMVSEPVSIKEKMEAEALALAKKSEVIVFVGGISPDLEGEEMDVPVVGFSGGDRTNLDMPCEQTQLLEKLKNTGKAIVLVLVNGSALSANWASENIPSIVEAWYPGEEGGNAIADVLFGDYNPSGRLPVTFYKSVNDLPAFDDYSMKGRTYKYLTKDPLYPFGYGLSYSKFEYSDLKLSNVEISSNSVLLDVKVTNVSRFDGDEVVQVYVDYPATTKEKPLKSLVAFEKVKILNGKVADIKITIPFEQLRLFDTSVGDYTIPKGKYEFQVGASSADIRVRANLEIK